jgi:hypothetical protein
MLSAFEVKKGKSLINSFGLAVTNPLYEARSIFGLMEKIRFDEPSPITSGKKLLPI